VAILQRGDLVVELTAAAQRGTRQEAALVANLERHLEQHLRVAPAALSRAPAALPADHAAAWVNIPPRKWI
jgi:hypothetical protein